MGFGDNIPKRSMGWQPHSNPKIAKRFKRNVNQGAKRPLILLTLLQTAAKRRRESEGIIPSGRFGRQPKVTPRNPKIAKRFIKRSVNQGAKRPLIPLTLLEAVAKRRWGLGIISPSGVWDGNPIVTPVTPKSRSDLLKETRIRERSVP